MANEKATGLFEGDNLLNSIVNLLNSIVNISKAGAYDILAQQVKELQAENKALREKAEKETRIYVVNADDFDFHSALDEEIITHCEETTGNIYSLKGFEEQINNEELDLTNSFIRIISI